MWSLLLIIIPFVIGIFAFFMRSDFRRRGLIIVGAAVHLIISCLVFINHTAVLDGKWFAFDNISIVFLLITSILFFGVALYCIQYLADESSQSDDRNQRFSKEAFFSSCFLVFLSAMTLVIASQQLALLWVGIEATTLASAPLIYFHKTKRSLEATWKYLLICSVGIAIALMGLFFLAVAGHDQQKMFLTKMVEQAHLMNPSWLKASFLLLFVGYGTKMGLAPFHTWLPDAHSEAPSAISALLSGALLNCAFLGIIRVYQICIAAGLQEYCQEVFVVFGLISVLVAGVFILGQSDYKRMLAYSSVEHQGIIILGLGIGGSAVFGSMINMIGHSFTKVGLFLVAGNLLSYFKTKKIADIKGLISGKMRATGILWLIGFLLITGTPPSGIFLGKIIILTKILYEGHYWIAFILLLALAIVFIGFAHIFISMTQGQDLTDKNNQTYIPICFSRIFVPGAFFALAIGIGLYFPDWLSKALHLAAKSLGGV